MVTTMSSDERHARSGPARSGRSGGSGIALPVGTVLEGYVIRDVLGLGGFGITYLAEDETLGKQFAIKEHFPRDYAERDGVTVRPTRSGAQIYDWSHQRFLEEARRLARFKHPAIVDVARVFTSHGTTYIVLAYEKGQTFADWIEGLGRPPSQGELDRILPPLLDALEIVHGAGLMHRDISPDNIMIRENGTPVLLDFGAAREALGRRSRNMSAIVKPGYSPHEQYSSDAKVQGPWSDIYALAGTLYYAIKGEPPHESPRRMLDDDMQPLATSLATAASYRPTFLAAIDAGLKVQPRLRPQSIAAWRLMLLDGQGHEPATVRDQGRRAATVVAQPGGATQVRRAPHAGAAVAARGHHAPSAVHQRQPQDLAGSPGGLLPPEAPRPSRAPLAIAVVLLMLAGGGAGAFLWQRSNTANEERVALAWVQVERSEDPEQLEQFASRHPGTRQAELARQRAEQIRRQRTASTQVPGSPQPPKAPPDTTPPRAEPPPATPPPRTEPPKAELPDGIAEFREGARLYDSGRGNPRDFARAREQFLRAAEKGNSSAMNNLGVMAQRGHGIARDFAEARRWYEQASARGVHLATTNLGVLYENGLGVPVNLQVAREHYERAAAGGDGVALFRLGDLYRFGRGVATDHARALSFYEQSAARGEERAMTALGILYRSGTGVRQDMALARQWFERAIAKGAPFAMVELALMHERGVGGPVNGPEALRLFEQAAERQNHVAHWNLARLYEEGRLVTQDFRAAARHALTAARLGNARAREVLLSAQGPNNENVRRNVQQELKDAGHYTGAVNGVWDATVVAAVHAYFRAQAAPVE